MTPAQLRPAAVCVAVAAIALSAPTASAQRFTFANGDRGEVVGTVGSAEIVETIGQRRRIIYHPTPQPLLESRWLVVQDELSGVLFEGPGGMVAWNDRLVGDFTIHANQSLLAIEVRTVAFDVWGDPIGVLSATSVDERASAEIWAMSPEWDDPRSGTFRTSLSWVHRVMFEDESVLEVDEAVVRAAWSIATERPFEDYRKLDVTAVSGR